MHQLYDPHGIYIDNDQTIFIADFRNNRIVTWKKNASNGEIVAGGKGQGNENDRLHNPRNVLIDHRNNFLIISDQKNQRVVRWPRIDGINGTPIISNIDCHGLAMDFYGYLYVADVGKSEVRRWIPNKKDGTLVAGGNGIGNGLNQFNNPRYIFVDEEQSVYVSDNHNHRIMKWVKGAYQGVIVAGGNGQGSRQTQLHYPEGLIVDQSGTIYIVDSWNDRVVRWMKGASHGEIIIGANGRGESADRLNSPRDIFFDYEGNLYVVDHNNHRIQKFLINQLI